MKLKLIRASLFVLVLSYTFICHAQKHPDFSYNKSANPWVTAFKDQVFVYSLKTAYQSDSTIFKLLERKDAFNPYDGLNLEALNKASY